jgi:uncharacterized membrane protein
MEFLNRLFNALFELHPVHTMVVHYPIALTTAALVFALIALWRRSRVLENVAYYNTILASITSVLAGLTGLWDNATRYEGDAPNAGLKIFIGISLFLLTTITVLVRRRQPDILWQSKSRVLYVAAHVGSFVLATILGFLGGVILYGF